MNNFKDKNVVVIGGSRGIGLETVRRLLDAGAAVTVWSRTRSPELEELGVPHEPYDAAQPFAEQSVTVPERLDGLVYCPGSITLASFKQLKAEQFRADYEINVVGAVEAIKGCLKPLAAAGGSVVLFATVASSLGMGFHASIAAAKSGVLGLTISLAAELAPQKVRVNAVSPSLTDTELAGRLLGDEKKRQRSAERHPLKRVGEVGDIAAAVVYLLSDDASWVTGQNLRVDGGMSTVAMS